MAALRAQVVYIRDDRAGRFDARPSRREHGGRARTGSVLRANARRARASAQHLYQPAKGQTRHAQSADRRTDARRHPCRTCQRHNRGRAKHRADAQLHAPLERHQCCGVNAARTGAGPRLRTQTFCLRRAARRATAPPGHAGQHASRDGRSFPSRLLRRGIGRARGSWRD